MSYKEAVEATGAIVLAEKWFGDYQGSWYMKIQYEGSEFWISGSFGSCSGCDAFQSEFDWSANEDDPDYKIKLAEFGMSYVSDPIDFDTLRANQVKNLEWDSEASEVITWLDANK